MKKILCSTGAVIGRPNGRDFKLLKNCVEKLKCDGYEFMMYNVWHEKTEELLDFMSGLCIDIPVFHVEKDVGNLISKNGDGDVEKALELFEKNCFLANSLGSDKLVLHLWGGLDSDKNMSHNIRCYELLRSISDLYGLSLMIENVVCNRNDPMHHLKELVITYPDIQFTFDTKMAAFHDQVDLLYEEEFNTVVKNIRHMHINDYSGGYMDWSNLKTLHIGDGNINFEKLFDFLKWTNYDGDFTVEATSFDQNGVIDYEALNRSFEIIREFITYN